MCPTVTKKRKKSTKKKSVKRKGIAKSSFVPRKTQRLAAKFLLARPESGLFASPGFGKTAVILAILEVLKLTLKRKKRKTLIVAKLRIIVSVWPKEIEKWGFPFTYSLLHGKDKEEKVLDDSEIHLINYEGFFWLKDFILDGSVKYDDIIFDESSKIKNTNTKRYKILKKILHLFKRRHIITGSPVPNSMEDIFGQIFALDGGVALGRYITKFRNDYFYPCGYMGYEYKLQEGAEERIYDRISPLVIRLDEEKSAGVPKEKFNDIKIELNPKARKFYKSLEKDYIAQINQDVITAANAGVLTQKLRQVANGSIYNETRKIKVIHEEKIEALIELVEELQGSPCLVGYEFNHDLVALQKAFPNAPFIGGKVSIKKGLEIEMLWNEGRFPLLFGQIATVSHGLNLQRAGRDVCFYSLTWNLEDYEQFIRRVRRAGNKYRYVNIHRIIATDTVDLDVISTLERKDRGQKALLSALLRRSKALYNL